MFPTLPVHYLSNGFSAYPKKGGNVGVLFSFLCKLANLQDVLLRKLGIAASLPFGLFIEFLRPGMNAVIRARNPFEITKRVVGLIPTLVIYFGQALRVRQKRFRYKSVDVSSDSSGFGKQRHGLIAPAIIARSLYPTFEGANFSIRLYDCPSKRTNSPEVRYLVSAGKLFNRKPYFSHGKSALMLDAESSLLRGAEVGKS